MALAADYMTFFMICSLVRMAPLFGENEVLLNMKKWLSSRLCACSLFIFTELLCEAIVVWLCE